MMMMMMMTHLNLYIKLLMQDYVDESPQVLKQLVHLVQSIEWQWEEHMQQHF